MKNRIIVVAVLLLVVFLAGFVPSYARVHRLENGLRRLGGRTAWLPESDHS